MRNLRHGLVAAGLVLGAAGCPSFVSLQTARALDEGQLEVTAALSAIGLTDNGTLANGTRQAGGAAPDFYLATRYGVTSGLDVGVKIQPATGFMATSTLQIHHGDLLDLALTPDLGFYRVAGPIQIGVNTSTTQYATLPNYTLVPVDLPLLIGVNLPHEHQLILGPRISGWISVPQPVYAEGAVTTGGLEVFAGAALGLSLKVANKVRVMPELDVMKPVAWTGQSPALCGEYSCAPYPTAGFIWQFSLGITTGLLGGDGFL